MTNWATLGDIIFDLFTAPVDFQAVDAFHFAEIKMASGKPVLQAIGSDLQTLNLRCKLHGAVNANPELDLRSWTDSRLAGDPLPLVVWGINDGIYAQRFVIEKLEHQVNQYTADGRMWDVDVSLTLKEWSETAALTILPGAPKGGRAVVKEGAPPPAGTQTVIQTNSQGYSQPFITAPKQPIPHATT